MSLFGVANDPSDIAEYLKGLHKKNVVKHVGEPQRLATISGRPVNIVEGDQIPIVRSSSGGSSVSFVQCGTVVNFVPVILDNGKIKLEVAASISQPDDADGVSIATCSNAASAPGLTTRGIQAAAELHEGQTMVIGGLTGRHMTGDAKAIPIFGDIPFIAAISRWLNGSENNDFELVILVTPRIIP
jgi:pilus assembly protein CpaC